MAFVESKLKNVGDQSFYAYIDELRRQEEEKNRQLMERAAARNFASQQQQPIPEWKKVQQQNVGNVGASYAPGYSGIGNQMTWAEGMRRGAAQMGVPVETYLQHMTPIGSGMVSESVSPTEGIPENVLANKPLPLGREAQLSQQYTQAEDKLMREKELFDTKYNQEMDKIKEQNIGRLKAEEEQSRGRVAAAKETAEGKKQAAEIRAQTYNKKLDDKNAKKADAMWDKLAFDGSEKDINQLIKIQKKTGLDPQAIKRIYDKEMKNRKRLMDNYRNTGMGY